MSSTNPFFPFLTLTLIKNIYDPLSFWKLGLTWKHSFLSGLLLNASPARLVLPIHLHGCWAQTVKLIFLKGLTLFPLRVREDFGGLHQRWHVRSLPQTPGVSVSGRNGSFYISRLISLHVFVLLSITKRLTCSGFSRCYHVDMMRPNLSTTYYIIGLEG